LVPSALAKDIASLDGMDVADVEFIQLAYSLTNVVSALLGGMSVLVIRPQYAFTIGVVCCSIGCLITAIAPSTDSDTVMALLMLGQVHT
jgi:hypothetical protein